MTATPPVYLCIVCGAVVPPGQGRRYRLPARRRFAVCRGDCRKRFDWVIGEALARVDAARESEMRTREGRRLQLALPDTVTAAGGRRWSGPAAPQGKENP